MQRSLVYVAPDHEIYPISSRFEAAGWRVEAVADLSDARRRLARVAFDVGLIDLGHFARTLDGVEYLCRADGHVQWIGLVPPEMRDDLRLRRLIRDHFFDYHTLPLDADRLLPVLGHAGGMARLERSLWSPAETAPAAAVANEPEMVGVGAPMLKVFNDIRKVGTVDAPVLISGESGTGKELAARAIHERSRRAGGPFIAVNCGALPSSLIQSELFGHERGAFTGALRRRKGSLELAIGGVLFLDEIAELALDQQVNLLRFLQEGRITRVGGSEEIRIDARVIAATNVDLERAVAEGRFREDLYFRLNVLRLSMPPLRDRRDDIPVLARYYFEQFAHERGRKLRGFSHAALEAMASYDWPGNVRELVSRVRRGLVMCDNRLLNPEDLGLQSKEARKGSQTLREAREAAEKAALEEALAASNGNLTEAARQLGVSRPALYRMLSRYGVRNS